MLGRRKCTHQRVVLADALSAFRLTWFYYRSCAVSSVHLTSSAGAALERTGDSCRFTLRVGGFTCEKQRVIQRGGQSPAGSVIVADTYVAVSAARKRIPLPVMHER